MNAGQESLLDQMSRQLDEIEAEMRRIGYWSSSPPELLGKVRSYLEAPSFELWLQQVFLPRARDAILSRNLPRDSSVGVMAMRQYDYHSHVEQAQPLVQMLSGFDALIRQYSAASD